MEKIVRMIETELQLNLMFLLFLTLALTLSGCGSNGGSDNEEDIFYTISGRVTLNGPGLAGVTITLIGSMSNNATTDADGNYTFTGLMNGSYTVAASMTGYTFTPVNIAVTINSADEIGQDFTALTVPPPYGKFKLPDTGQTTCYQGVDPYAEIPCAGTGQDGEYTINPMSFTDNSNGTVTDNNTGLMWQQDENPATYNWYQASGTYDLIYNPMSEDVCGELTTGVYTDWRLPAKSELITIADYSIPLPGPAINTAFFPKAYASYYWSSTAFSLPFYEKRSWCIYFNNGSSCGGYNYYSNYVRCVSGDQLSSSFSDNGNGTVTDAKTGLMWQQDEPGAMTWDSALSYCEGLSLGGNTDWRLPNIRELGSITDDTRYNPAIDTSFFPNAYAFYYWSSTTDMQNTYGARSVYFGNASIGMHMEKIDLFYVRCVSGGQ